jgi:hypothetical protein
LVEKVASDYAKRVRYRDEAVIPPLGICGHGRAGKDTAAEYLAATTAVVYPGSASQLVLPFIAHMIRDGRELSEVDKVAHEQQVFAERHQHRDFWIHACHAVRGEDYGFLVRMVLSKGDVVTGIRGRLELQKVLENNVIAAAVWIDNPRVPSDHTVEYTASDCDLTIVNDGSYVSFYAKLRKLTELLQFGMIQSKKEK